MSAWVPNPAGRLDFVESLTWLPCGIVTPGRSVTEIDDLSLATGMWQQRDVGRKLVEVSGKSYL